MTLLRIEPLASDGIPGGVAECRVRVRLTDARARNLIGLRTTDGAPVTAYVGALIPAGGPAIELELTPQSAIATPDGAPTYYQVELRARHVAQAWTIQVPDSLDVQDLMTLVGAAAIDPADIAAGRLLPAWGGEPNGSLLGVVDGDPAWMTAPPGSGDMQALIYDPRGIANDTFLLDNLTGNLDGGTY